MKKSMKELIFLNPVFHRMIWGGNRMASEFGYDIPGDDTGECWAVSANELGDCVISGGLYDGFSLGRLWREHRELFGNMTGDVFPLLVKIIDAKEDLSIQVHPDDKYAAAHENGALGKTECWYILDCDEEADIIIGHNASNRSMLMEMIKDGRWDELITPISIRKGDFFQINPGTVHAIRKGTMILEIQQNSTITYRLYDYDRLQNGKKRELHIDKSIDVIQCPQIFTRPERKKWTSGNAVFEELVDCCYYRVLKIDLCGPYVFSSEEPFVIVDIISNRGTVEGREIRKGEHFIIPSGYGEIHAEGNMTAIVSIPKYDENERTLIQ